MVALILLGGYACTWAGRKYGNRLISNDPDGFLGVWWPKQEIKNLFLLGIAACLIFFVISYIIIYSTAHIALSNSSVIDIVLSKMEYKLVDKKGYSSISNLFLTENSSQEWEAEYAIPSSNEENKENLRNLFIDSYFVDADPKFKKENPRGLLHDVANEKDHNIDACRNGMGTLLGLWLKSTQSDSTSFEWNEDIDALSCIEGLVNHITSDPIYKAQIKRKDVNVCKYKKFLESYENHVSSQLLPGMLDMLFTVSGMNSFKPPSSYDIASNPPKADKDDICGGFRHKSSKAIGQKILVAQINNLKDSLEAPYRMGVIVFGPIQFVLLSLFFATCIGLGERRSFGLDEVTGINKFIGNRAVQAKKANPTITEKTVKQLMISELSEEASFPFDFSNYALGVIGFIGTVIGIASSLEGAPEVVAAASRGLAAQQEAITGVTSLLGVAFDTTLIALASGVFVYFFHEYCKTHEKAFIRKDNTIVNTILNGDSNSEGGSASAENENSEPNNSGAGGKNKKHKK
jgi:hypothetical protein